MKKKKFSEAAKAKIRSKLDMKIKLQRAETPLNRLILSLEGESKVIMEDWIQSDTSLAEDLEFRLASLYMIVAATHLRKARNLGNI